MRLPNTAHTSRPWRIHELTRDFRLEDVWALPTPGGAGDFPKLVQGFSRLAASPQGSSLAPRVLWAIRWKVGALLGWDGPAAGLGSRVPTLRDRLPLDLRQAPAGPDLPHFSSLYALDDEWAAEIANQTVHGVVHIGWVPDETGGFRGQMAVLVKPNGVLGTGYVAAIKPFRHLIVYPAMLRQIERAWRPPAEPSPRAPARARQVAVAPAARALSTLGHVDYEDAFLVETGAAEGRTGEQWARAILEGAPSSMRRRLRRGWFALGLKLGSTRSDRLVLGWEVRRSAPDFALLAAGSRLGLPAELLFERRGDTLLVATFVRQRNPLARALWAAVAPTHRQVVPYLLERARR